MVKKIRELINYLLLNPLFLSSIILCFLFYTGVINSNNKNSFVSLIPISEIKELEGIVVSAPVKSLTNENYYFIDLNVTAVKSKENIYSQGKGIIKLLLKSDFVESLYPNKLNSKSKRNLLIESGLNIKLVVKSLNEDLFLVTDILDSFYEKSLKGRIFYFRALCRLNFKRLLNSWGNAGGLLLALLSGSKDDVNNEFTTVGVAFDNFEDGSMDYKFFSYEGPFPENKFVENKLPLSIKELKVYLLDHYYKNQINFFETNSSYREFLKEKFGRISNSFFGLFKKAIPFFKEIMYNRCVIINEEVIPCANSPLSSLQWFWCSL